MYHRSPSWTPDPRLYVLKSLLILALCSGFVEAQSQPTQSLSLGLPVERELTGGQSHSYRVSVNAGQAVLIEVQQRGIDLVLTANQTDGKQVASINLFPFGEGVEPLMLVSDTTGEFNVTVTSSNPKAAAGKYEARITELRTANDQDRIRLKAQTLSLEAQNLSFEKPVEAKRKAVQVYGEALLLWQQLHDQLWESTVLLRLGRLNITLTEFRQAKDYFSQALIAKKALGDRRGEATAHSGVCEAMHYLADNRGKAECLDRLILIHRELGNRLEIGKVLSNKAVTYNTLGDYPAALQAAQEALEIFRLENDSLQESFALNTLGQIYRSLNEHQLALDHYERALVIRRQGTDRRLLGITLGDMGVTYFELGDNPRALDYLTQALAISDELGDRRSKAIRLNGLSLIWQRMGDTNKALEAQKQSLVLAREVGDRQAESRALIALSELYAFNGDTKTARDLLTQALELARAAGDPVAETSILRDMGKLAAANGVRKDAIDLLQQSLSLAQAVNNLQGERDALINLAEIEREANHFDEALSYHAKALEVTESLRTKILDPGLRATYLALRQDEYELFIDLLMQMHRRQPNAGHDAAAFQISERGRARSLLDTLAEAHAEILQGVDTKLLDEERQLADRIRSKERERAQLFGKPGATNQLQALVKEIGDLLNQYQSLQSRIRATSPRYMALVQPQPITAGELQKKYLDKQTVLLEFSLGEKQSWLWAIASDAITSYSLPQQAEIETQARKVYELLTTRQLRKRETDAERETRITAADSKLASEIRGLSQKLLGGISDKLTSEWKDKRLLIVAGGALEYLPFGALVLPSSNQPLVVDHEVINLPSASVLSVIRQKFGTRPAVSKAVAVMADPVFEINDPRVLMAVRTQRQTSINTRSGAEPRSLDPNLMDSSLRRSLRSVYEASGRGTLSRLPFSREEAAAVASLVPGKALLKATDFQASRALATSGELSNYRVVHFATHGLLNSEHPELSGLVLSLVDETGKPQDGFLRMNEIYNLRLPADVVVLSACQTGLGKEIKGEGLIGLTRGFMYAGAKSIVASLWQVDDLATAELMKGFYRGLLKEHLSPAAALRTAQLELMKKERWSSPYFWSAFIIQGDWK